MSEVKEYLSLITSQHKDKQKFVSTITTTIELLIDCLDCLSSINQNFIIETAAGDQLQIIADWVGAENAITNGLAIEFFGFAGQSNALGFSETDNPSEGGYFRDSGVSSYRALQMTNEQFKQAVKAKILLNQSDSTIDSAREIVSLITDIPFLIKDHLNMSVTFEFLESYKDADRELVRMMFPLPSGVKLYFEGEDEY